jgi:hypothetical protein
LLISLILIKLAPTIHSEGLKKFLKKIWKFLALPAIIGVGLLLSSWGHEGHRIISSKSVLSYNKEMSQFWVWAGYLANHSSDPDNRRSSDPNEKPKHFIDIDNYPEFVKNGNFSLTFEDAVKLHGREFVFEQGILPWATLATYNSLEKSFEKSDWKQVAFYAADLGHYIADGHMPFHITRNYDGQFSGNTGIHGRYESTMIDKIEDSISYVAQPAFIIQNPEAFIFFYLNHNYAGINTILEADSVAKKIAGNTRSDTYTEVLWSRTRELTNKLFSNASQAFASLVYTAWVKAGSPKMNTSNSDPRNNFNEEVLNVKHEGMFNNAVKINYTISVDSKTNISVYDRSGNFLETLVDTIQPPGFYSIRWKPEKKAKRACLVILKSENDYSVKRLN